jgi:hypothetical protein
LDKMAQYLLFSTIVINNTYAPSIPNFTTVAVYWNTSTNNIDVTVGGTPTTTSFTLGQRGTHWAMAGGTSSYSNQTSVSQYSFCSGTTLNWFQIIDSFPTFPFAERKTTANSATCQTGIVCDIHFVGAPEITHATNLTSNNGAITAPASSSNGTVKYALSDFDYATEGQTSDTFTGLSPGAYTIYAKDANSCTAQLSFTILFEPAYTEHYRFVWTNFEISGGNNRTSRVRIYEREYSGDLVEIDNGGMPVFTLRKPKPQGELNNKFSPIHTTSAELILMSEVDYQYLPLYTQDNKKFYVVYEMDEGGGYTEIWSGFIVPSVYNEPFIAAPYPVTLQITDNIVTLQEEDFADDDGNQISGDVKLIKVIAQVLRKTGLELNIRSGINIFEENHNTAATDDPLDQTYIDTACYRGFTCWEVLVSILTPFGAKIYQYDNTWIIEEIDRSTDTYAYREFDYMGDYVSNSTFDPVIDIKAPDLADRVAFKDQDQILEIIPAYGKIEIVSRLNYTGSIISGGFEKSDLLSPETEEFYPGQSVFRTEDGFNGWSLKLPSGVSGVSFGRATTNSDISKTVEFKYQKRAGSKFIGLFLGVPTVKQRKYFEYLNLITGTEGQKSVGVFFHSYANFQGNVREAYIESAEKPYQYKKGDRIRFSFEYATPCPPEYEFIVLRFVVKLGSNYLQNDLTWDTAESIFRAYPKPSLSFQKFEIDVAAPDPVGVEVEDSTIQVKIYYYAFDDYDFGSAPIANSTDPGDGTDGQTELDALVTTTIDYDYRFDMRHQLTIGSTDFAQRGFYELRYSAAGEDIPAVFRAGDFNATTNPKVFYLLKAIPEQTVRRDKLDQKFFIDNVRLDALINGQEPPEEAKTSLNINRFVNEDLTIELYNFDCPDDITNAKNMYNNYFKLSDGTPTALWTRTGVAELLSLQQILLKVLGSNHSAPTFRLTGSFLSEFFRIGMDNTLRLTKAGSSLSLSNTGFASNLNGWSQTGSGEAFVYSADNSGSAQVTLSGSEDSQKIYQTVSHSGGYITITYQVQAVATSSNDREDILYVLFFRDSSLVSMEKMTTFAAPTSTTIVEDSYIAFAPSNITRVGFYFKRVAGTGDCTYNVGTFAPVGSDIEEIYQITDYSFDERANSYQLELMQISKSYISLQGTDQGGNNQGDASIGSQFSGAYSSAFGGSFDTVLN